MSERETHELRSRNYFPRRAMKLIAGAAVCLSLTFVGGRLSGFHERDNEQRQAAIQNKQREQANQDRVDERINALAKKYDFDKLNQDAKDAFVRLTQLKLEDISALYLDTLEAGRLLQDDIKIVWKGIVTGTRNVYDSPGPYELARDLIPLATQTEMVKTGFVFSPIHIGNCETAPPVVVGKCGHFHPSSDFAVREGPQKEKVILIPLTSY